VSVPNIPIRLFPSSAKSQIPARSNPMPSSEYSTACRHRVSTSSDLERALILDSSCVSRAEKSEVRFGSAFASRIPRRTARLAGFTFTAGLRLLPPPFFMRRTVMSFSCAPGSNDPPRDKAFPSPDCREDPRECIKNSAKAQWVIGGIHPETEILFPLAFFHSKPYHLLNPCRIGRDFIPGRKLEHADRRGAPRQPLPLPRPSRSCGFGLVDASIHAWESVRDFFQ
jgi:hypothetical protein